ncbi:MAG TPA: hypothetical protein VK446_05325, partial [Methylocystis sp.]|nr:hypothetical protein [Methylocystis sp.]
MPSDSPRRHTLSHLSLNEQIDRPDDRNASAGRTASFARAKFLWLDQVSADSELTPLAFMLAYVLANLVNEREGYAWPSVAHLAS